MGSFGRSGVAQLWLSYIFRPKWAENGCFAALEQLLCGHGGATTTGPDATYPPAICQNSGGGGGGGGGGVLPGVWGGVLPGVGGGGGLAGGQGGVGWGERGGWLGLGLGLR